MRLKSLFQKYLRRFDKHIKLLAFLGFFFFSIQWFFRFFSVKTVELIGENRKEILGLKNVYGKNLIFLDEKELSSKLLSYNPYLKKVTVQKIYPNKLILQLNFRKPLALLKVKEGFFVLDKEGRLLERIRSLNRELPLINFYQNFDFEEFYPGEYLNYIEIKYSLYFLDLLYSFEIKVKTVDILRGDMIRFNLKENNFEIKEIKITTEKDLEKEEIELKDILKYLKVSGRKAKEIDLRFKRPILKY